LDFLSASKKKEKKKDEEKNKIPLLALFPSLPNELLKTAKRGRKPLCTFAIFFLSSILGAVAREKSFFSLSNEEKGSLISKKPFRDFREDFPFLCFERIFLRALTNLESMLTCLLHSLQNGTPFSSSRGTSGRRRKRMVGCILQDKQQPRLNQ